MSKEEELLKTAISILEQTKTLIENKTESEDYFLGRPLRYWPDKYLKQLSEKAKPDGFFSLKKISDEELENRKEHGISVIEVEEK